MANPVYFIQGEILPWAMAQELKRLNSFSEADARVAEIRLRRSLDKAINEGRLPMRCPLTFTSLPERNFEDAVFHSDDILAWAESEKFGLDYKSLLRAIKGNDRKNGESIDDRFNASLQSELETMAIEIHEENGQWPTKEKAAVRLAKDRFPEKSHIGVETILRRTKKTWPWPSS